MKTLETTPCPLVCSIAERLDNARRRREPIQPITELDGIADIETAYAIQAQWTSLRQERGEKVVGRKIGLTSKAVQEQLGVGEPDYGTLWESSFYEAKNGRVTIPASDFIQPRIEGEIAFLIGESLREPGITAERILAATEACALGIEIVDSRIANWKIKLIDTVADNASFGGFTLGPWDKRMREADLSALEMRVVYNGAPAGDGLGSAVLGHPARSAAWLANKLLGLGVSLEPGDVVISGALMKMLPFGAGDEFAYSLTGQPDLTITIV